MDTTSVYAEITKTAPQDDGTLMVFGKATGSDLDLDQQRCDPAWLKRAMPEWFKIGNVREQHDSKRAAGKAVEHEAKDDGHWIKANIVDPVAIAKTKAGVYTGFSIGIMRPRVEKSTDAPNGVIMDGSICEISLVDRPALPTATLTMCKSAKPGMQVKAGNFDAQRLLVKCEEIVDKTVDKSPEEMTVSLADAIPPDQLEKLDAIAQDSSADEALAQAKTLVADVLAKADSGVLPPEYDAEQGDVLNAQTAISIISQLIVSEANEMMDNPSEDCDIEILLNAVSALRCFIRREQQQAMGADVVMLAAASDLTKGKYSADDMRSMLKDGKAFKNAKGEPSYPIADKEDLSNAIKAVGRGSGDHDAIRKYIKRRASALGASDMIPEEWNSDGSNKAAEVKVNVSINGEPIETAVTKTVEDADTGAKSVETVSDDAPEPFDPAADKGAAEGEADKVDKPADADNSEADKSTEPDTSKAAVVEDEESDGDALVKALSGALEKADSPLRKSFEAIVEAATKTTAESVDSLTERLVKVEQMAVPGGPALRRTEVERKQARAKDLVAEVSRFKALARGAEDTDLRKGYSAKAAQLEAEIGAL